MPCSRVSRARHRGQRTTVGPAPGRFADWDRDAWIAALDANMLAPLALIRAVLDGMASAASAASSTSPPPWSRRRSRRWRCRPEPAPDSRRSPRPYRSDVATANVTINNLLPERIDTDRQRQMAELHASMAGITVDEAYAHMATTIAAGRLGRPERVRRRVRLPVQRAGGIHQRTEPPGRRGQLRRGCSDMTEQRAHRGSGADRRCRSDAADCRPAVRQRRQAKSRGRAPRWHRSPTRPRTS
jgi:hypothetical protein